MKFKRIVKHLLTTQHQVTKAFPPHTLKAIEQTIKASEAAHVGEIRFAVEDALDGAALFKGQSPRDRAIELFAQLRVWDTEHYNGLLIYLLLADRAVEIVADRGIHAKIDLEAWSKICRQMEGDFKQSNYEGGVVTGIKALTQHLSKHFPADGVNRNELPDKPVLV
nr:TPM domain-containing protein [Rhodoferax sp.]